ncbi:hypothetical protein X767_23055 [Mesorhizobium sp. LSJC264A00]|nr:hypothetical protein X767_23055 [Mesorhizobium sp. LSJC264A00]
MDPDGFVGGIYAGYNYQLGNNLVLGIEGDINYADVHGLSPLLSAAGISFPDQNFDGKVDWTGSIRGRLGYSIDRFLPFVTAGGAFAHYDVGNTVVGTEHALNDTLSGWTVGVGADYAFTDSLIGRVEYRYSDFGTTRAGAVLFQDYDVDLKTNDIRIGLAYKF